MTVVRLMVVAFMFLCAGRAGAEVTNVVTHLDLPTNLWFRIGEELGYRVYWGKIPVGTVTVKAEWAEWNGRKLIAIRYRALSNKFLSALYPVDSFIESLIDPVTFKSVRFTKDTREGRHRHHEITTFDYEALTARWVSLTKKKEKTFPLEADTRDLVAFMYAVRASPFVTGEVRQCRVMADDDIYDLWIRVREQESVVLPNLGKVASLRVDPEAAFNGMFVRKGKITVWVSADERRLVTRVDASVPVVSDIHALLSSVAYHEGASAGPAQAAKGEPENRSPASPRDRAGFRH